jgi:hypothetical protein
MVLPKNNIIGFYTSNVGDVLYVNEKRYALADRSRWTILTPPVKLEVSYVRGATGLSLYFVTKPMTLSEHLNMWRKALVGLFQKLT